MKAWCWASAWIFGILCAVHGGFAGLIGGGIIGFVVGALIFVAAAYLSLAIRLLVWTGLLGMAALLLSR